MPVNPYGELFWSAEPIDVEASRSVRQLARPKRTTNWWTIVGAVAGLAIGFLTATYPTPEQMASDALRAEAIGFLFGQATGSLIVGACAGWFLSWLFARPLRAFVVIGGLGGILLCTWTSIPNRILNSHYAARAKRQIPQSVPHEQLMRRSGK